MVCLSGQYHFKLFKSFRLQILLGPFLNNLIQMYVCLIYLMPIS